MTPTPEPNTHHTPTETNTGETSTGETGTGGTGAAASAAASVSTLVGLSRLYAARPGPGASMGAMAGWYRDKQRLHLDLASEAAGRDPGGLEQHTELAHAAAAGAHAAHLAGWDAAAQQATAELQGGGGEPSEGVAA